MSVDKISVDKMVFDETTSKRAWNRGFESSCRRLAQLVSLAVAKALAYCRTLKLSPVKCWMLKSPLRLNLWLANSLGTMLNLYRYNWAQCYKTFFGLIYANNCVKWVTIHSIYANFLRKFHRKSFTRFFPAESKVCWCLKWKFNARPDFATNLKTVI